MISSVDFYFQHSFSSSRFIRYQFSLNQNFSFGLNILCGGVWPSRTGEGNWSLSDQIRAFVGLSPGRIQFPGPSELLICPSRREYWHKGEDRPLHFAGTINVSPGPCQATLGPLTGPELQSPHHQCPRTLLRLWTHPALGPPVLPHASNIEFKLSAQVEKDPDGLLPP